jgi:hypothetical protein
MVEAHRIWVCLQTFSSASVILTPAVPAVSLLLWLQLCFSCQANSDLLVRNYSWQALRQSGGLCLKLRPSVRPSVCLRPIFVQKSSQSSD